MHANASGGRQTRPKSHEWLRSGDRCPDMLHDEQVAVVTDRRDTDIERGERIERGGPHVRSPAPAAQPAGSATTNRLLAKPFGSRKIRPPIAFISRRAANSPMPEPRTAAAPLDPHERLEDALPVLDRDARPVVGDVDLDLVADAARRRCSRPRRTARTSTRSRAAARAPGGSAPRRRSRSSARPAAPSGSGAAGAGAGASRRSRRPPSTASNGARDSPVSPSPRTDARIESTRRSSRASWSSAAVAPGLGRLGVGVGTAPVAASASRST